MSSVTQGPEDATKRMGAQERREQIIDAAIAVFGSKGYTGTTTDDVARAASVSQPYVVRLFGSKEQLYLDALGSVLDRLIGTFRAALPGDREHMPERVGAAYMDLLSVRGLGLMLSQSFLLGGDPVIGPAARAGFGKVWHFLRHEAGIGVEDARMFLANGMLINTIVGLRLTEAYGEDEDITDVLMACFPTKLQTLLELAPRADERW